MCPPTHRCTAVKNNIGMQLSFYSANVPERRGTIFYNKSSGHNMKIGHLGLFMMLVRFYFTFQVNNNTYKNIESVKIFFFLVVNVQNCYKNYIYSIYSMQY